MARPIVLTKTLAASSVNNVAQSQALGGSGGALTINGSAATNGVATLDTQRRISILSSGNDSGLTWTVTGAGDSGTTISEKVTGGNGVAVATLQDFLTVTSVSGSGATAGTVQVGTNGVGSTPWQVPNQHITPFELSMDTHLVTGVANWSIEIAETSPLAPLPIYSNAGTPIPATYTWPGLSALAADAQGEITKPVLGWRLTINSGLGTVQAVGTQAGIRN